MKFLRNAINLPASGSKKWQKDISDINQKIISRCVKETSIWQISENIVDIYGFETYKIFCIIYSVYGYHNTVSDS